MEAARIGAAILLTLALFQFALRPMIRKVTVTVANGTAALSAGQSPTLSDVSQQGKIEALSTHATTLSHREPETAARLVRAWLEEEKR